MKSKVAQLLERYGYAQEAKPSEYNIRGWHSQQYALPVNANPDRPSRHSVLVTRGVCLLRTCADYSWLSTGLLARGAGGVTISRCCSRICRG